MAILANEAGRQIAPDGVPREQAIGYGRFVLEFLLLSILAGRASKVAPPLILLDRAAALIRFLARIKEFIENPDKLLLEL